MYDGDEIQHGYDCYEAWQERRLANTDQLLRERDRFYADCYDEALRRKDRS